MTTKCFKTVVFKISGSNQNTQDGAFVAHHIGHYETIRLFPKFQHYLHNRVCFIAFLKRDNKDRFELELTIYNKDTEYCPEI